MSNPCARAPPAQVRRGNGTNPRTSEGQDPLTDGLLDLHADEMMSPQSIRFVDLQPDESSDPPSDEVTGLVLDELMNPVLNEFELCESAESVVPWIHDISSDHVQQCDNDDGVQSTTIESAMSTTIESAMSTTIESAMSTTRSGNLLAMPGTALSPQASEMEQWLFHHYVHKVSKVLVNVDSSSNPLRYVLIPRATNSPVLMSALYANSACHVSVYSNSPTMQRSSLSYYSKAASALATMVANTGPEIEAGDLEILLLTTVLLCT